MPVRVVILMPLAAVIVIGDVMTDVIVGPEGPLVPGSDRRATIRALPGGSGANQAAWLAHFGLPVRFVARVGAADRDRLAAALAASGIEPRLAADRRSADRHPRPSSHRTASAASYTDRGANDGLADRRPSPKRSLTAP